MILYKEKTSTSGITTKYHVIDTLNLRENQLRCHLESYMDTSYITNKKPAGYYSFCFTVTESELNTPIIELVIQKIGALEEWAGVTKVNEIATTDEVIEETTVVEETIEE